MSGNAIALWGTKVGMTRVYADDVATPVTVIEVAPNEIVEVKTAAKHGYDALKVAVGPAQKKKSKALAGEYSKADVAPRRFLREITPLGGDAELGGKVTVERLSKEAKIDIVGTSKGRGFAGVMKRHNFGGGRASHGSEGHRLPGSIGCRMDPGKVHKNKKMPGHYGAERITVRNLVIVDIDTERGLVLVKGSIPGPIGGLVAIKQAQG